MPVVSPAQRPVRLIDPLTPLPPNEARTPDMLLYRI